MTEPAIFEISLNLQLEDRSEKSVRNEVRAALAEAIADAKGIYDMQAETEVKGAFLGVGEAALILTIVHLLKVGAAAAAAGAVTGAGTETGKEFAKAYLIPRLRAHGILPGEPKDVTPGRSDGTLAESKE